MIGKPRGGGFGDGAAQFERAEAALRETKDVKRENKELRDQLKAGSSAMWSAKIRKVGRVIGFILLSCVGLAIIAGIIGLAGYASSISVSEYRYGSAPRGVGPGVELVVLHKAVQRAEPAEEPTEEQIEEQIEERLEFGINNERGTITYYYGDEESVWLTIYQHDSVWSDLNALTIWHGPRRTSMFNIYFDAERNPTTIYFSNQNSDCDVQKNQQLCNWAKERLDEWIARLDSLNPNQTVEQMMRDGVDAPLPPNHELFSPPARNAR